MNGEIIFPRGVASGEAFCNRVIEKSRLKMNIETGSHTLIISPRRYGKTSLVNCILKEMQLPFGDVDLFVAVDGKRIEQLILGGIRKIIETIGSPIEQVLESLRAHFKNKDTEWTIGTKGAKISLIPSEGSDPATNILEALQGLEHFLEKKSQKAVLFLDEIQEIGEIASGSGIEGAIRHVAQNSKHLFFIFSGSNRHLLSKMFFDKSRPLYKLCDRIILKRIPESEYRTHINKFAHKKWGTLLDPALLDEVFKLTELHPYHTNSLCNRLWAENNEKAPLIDNVKRCWVHLLEEERSEILMELSTLSLGQKKVLISIANGKRTGLTSKESLSSLGLTGSSVIEAISVLEQKDYIEKIDDKQYQLIDPLLKYSLIESH